MTKEEKIQMLTGALAALIDRNDGYFYHFATIPADQAEEMLNSDGFAMGVSAGGNLWIADGHYRWVFSDKALAAIAK